jgi:hypothetical protein
VVIGTARILNAYRLFLVLTILRLVAVTVDRILLHVTADSPIVRGPSRPIESEQHAIQRPTHLVMPGDCPTLLGPS